MLSPLHEARLCRLLHQTTYSTRSIILFRSEDPIEQFIRTIFQWRSPIWSSSSLALEASSFRDAYDGVAEVGQRRGDLLRVAVHDRLRAGFADFVQEGGQNPRGDDERDRLQRVVVLGGHAQAVHLLDALHVGQHVVARLHAGELLQRELAVEDLLQVLAGLARARVANHELGGHDAALSDFLAQRVVGGEQPQVRERDHARGQRVHDGLVRRRQEHLDHALELVGHAANGGGGEHQGTSEHRTRALVAGEILVRRSVDNHSHAAVDVFVVLHGLHEAHVAGGARHVQVVDADDDHGLALVVALHLVDDLRLDHRLRDVRCVGRQPIRDLGGHIEARTLELAEPLRPLLVRRSRHAERNRSTVRRPGHVLHVREQVFGGQLKLELAGGGFGRGDVGIALDAAIDEVNQIPQGGLRLAVRQSSVLREVHVRPIRLDVLVELGFQRFDGVHLPFAGGAVGLPGGGLAAVASRVVLPVHFVEDPIRISVEVVGAGELEHGGRALPARAAKRVDEGHPHHAGLDRGAVLRFRRRRGRDQQRANLQPSVVPRGGVHGVPVFGSVRALLVLEQRLAHRRDEVLVEAQVAGVEQDDHLLQVGLGAVHVSRDGDRVRVRRGHRPELDSGAGGPRSRGLVLTSGRGRSRAGSRSSSRSRSGRSTRRSGAAVRSRRTTAHFRIGFFFLALKRFSLFRFRQDSLKEV
mmetsp:Transcript_8692/g.21045  ORF Transcript_8692/g.21045 Transcript_8692/m.21045 type:complete len:696 (+) Transcript_8692:978-3065(+)